MICNRCQEVAELGNPTAAAQGFTVQSVEVELTGVCAACRGRA